MIVEAVVRDDPRTCLLAAPMAQPQESRFSWVQRVCGAHQYSFGRINKLIGLERPVGDWDCLDAAGAWTDLTNLANSEHRHCDEAGYAMVSLLRAGKRRRLLLYDEGVPVCRWCPACFSEDATPYLRWEWRLSGITHCSKHHQRLQERCNWCSMPLCLNRSLLVDAGRSNGVADLGTCAGCGMPLFDADRADFQDSPETDFANAHQSLAQEMVAQIRASFQSNSRQMTLDFSRYSEVMQSCCQLQPVCGADDARQERKHQHADRRLRRFANAASWENLGMRRLPRLSGPALLINGHTFAPSVKLAGLSGTTKKRKWSRSLRPSDRTLLALAINVIRTEKKALRAMVVPPSTDR